LRVLLTDDAAIRRPQRANGANVDKRDQRGLYVAARIPTGPARARRRGQISPAIVRDRYETTAREAREEKKRSPIICRISRCMTL